MNKYEKIRLLGKGSFGAAWLVQRKSDKKQFVSKMIYLAGMKPPERQCANNEVKTLRSLNHPNITRYVDHFEEGNNLCIVMEYADGGDLYHFIKARGGRSLKEETILNIFSQICLALEHLHRKKILHRDIKSQNIFLTKDGVIKIGDLGISKILQHTFNMARTVCGTPYYFSPELCLHMPYNSKSDVWSTGCVLYELCTLTHPFDGPSLKALTEKIIRGAYAPISAKYSKDLSALLSSMLRIDPVKRPNISEIIQIPIVRNTLLKLKCDVEEANKGRRSYVEPLRNQDKEKEAEMREQEERCRAAQAEAAERERERKEKAQKAAVDELQRKMQERNRLHEQMFVLQKENEMKRLEEKRARQRKAIKQHDAKIAAAQKEREECWERNMRKYAEEHRELKRDEDDDNAKQRNGEGAAVMSPREGGIARAAGPRDQRAVERRVEKHDNGAQELYNPSAAKLIYFENQRQALANKRRCEQDLYSWFNPKAQGGGVTAKQPVPHVPHQSPKAGDRAQDRGGKGSDAKDEMEEARRQAFWQMRREADANRKRLQNQIDHEVEIPQIVASQAANAAPFVEKLSSPDPSPSDDSPVNKQVTSAAAKGVSHEEKGQEPQGVVINGTAAVSENEEQKVVNSDAIVGQAGVDKLENIALSREAQQDAEHHRELEYTAVSEAINHALSEERKCEDFSDPDEHDPGKFMLNGETLHLPNSTSKDPIMSRIECLRVFLENTLGESRFLKAYHVMDSINEEDYEESIKHVENLVTKSNERFIPLITQLLVCEDYFNQKMNGDGAKA